jgi:hypothetical protein
MTTTLREHLRAQLAKIPRRPDQPMSYAVVITTRKAPAESQCAPLFATEEEAKAYMPWLTRRNADRIVSARVVFRPNPPNASFDGDKLWFHLTAPQEAAE